MILGLDHVQVSAPAGCEGAAREFFGEFLGLSELHKPEALRANGGVWFALPDGRQLHVGVQVPFEAARKAHACLRCANLDQVLSRATEHAVAYEMDEQLELRRAYLWDPWGNRWEVVEGEYGALTAR